MTWSTSARRVPAFLVILLCIIGSGVSTALAKRPAAPELLPENTVMVLSVVDASDLSKRFMKTALGRMSQDPQLKPLVGHLYGSLSDAVNEAQEQVGLSLPELLAIPQGELTIALIAPKEGRPAVVALLDAGNQLSNARKLIKRATDELDKSDAKKSKETVAGTKFTIYDGVGPQNRKLAIFEKDSTICAGSDPEVLKQIVAAWDGKEKSARLVDNDAFATIMARCRSSKDERPQFIWFVNPIEIMRSIGRQDSGARVAIAVLPALGLDGLEGIGGTVALDAGPFESVAHTHVLLDSPRAGVLKMIALKSGDTKPEPWVPADAASYTTFHWDIQKSFEELSTIYDSFQGDGALAAVLKRRILGPTGINLEEELLPALDGRVTYVTWIERPITIASNTSLLALKLKETKPVEKALDKAVGKNDAFLIKETHAGKTFYKVKMPQPAEEGAENTEGERRRRRRGPPAQPEPCFGVLGGYLIACNRPSLYQQAIVTLADGSKSLANELDYKLVASKIKRQSGGEKPAMISFNRPEEGMRMIYELATSEEAQEQLRAGAENNPFLKSLDTALKKNPLPPFAVIRRYLAPGGAVVVDDETGIHYMAFSLRRK